MIVYNLTLERKIYKNHWNINSIINNLSLLVTGIPLDKKDLGALFPATLEILLWQ